MGRVRSLVRGAPRTERLGVSTQYLPEEVRPYAASFDRYGALAIRVLVRLRVVSGGVDVGWRPYHNGRWVSLRPYGWTWVGADRVGLADAPLRTLGAFGRCLVLDSGAKLGSGLGLVGVRARLCQLVPARLEQPRQSSSSSSVPGRGYDPWRAWTAVPDRHFGRGYVRDVAARNVYPGSPRGFVTAERAPDVRGYAVPRSSAPIRIAGTSPGRRTGSPVYTNLEPGGARVTGGRSRTMVGPSRATPLPAAPRPTPDSLDGARAVSRETAGTTNGVPYRPRAGEVNAPYPGATVTAPSGTNGIGRERASGAPAVAGTAVRRGDVRAAESGNIRADRERSVVGPVNGIQAPAGAGSRMAPYCVSAEQCATSRRSTRQPGVPAHARTTGLRWRRLQRPHACPRLTRRRHPRARRSSWLRPRRVPTCELQIAGPKEVAPSRAPNPGRHQGQRQPAAGSGPLRQRNRQLAHHRAEAHHQAEARHQERRAATPTRGRGGVKSAKGRQGGQGPGWQGGKVPARCQGAMVPSRAGSA